MTFYGWINLDMSRLLYLYLFIGVLYLISWVRIITVLKVKGLYLLVCWLLLHVLLVRFIYLWHRNDAELAMALVGVSFIATILFLFLRPEWLHFSLFKTIAISLIVLLVVFKILLEKNPVAFLHYKMVLHNEFEYPPYRAFKKEVDWKAFFKNHSERKWIQGALITFFEEGLFYDKEFSIALFVAWNDYNAGHIDKILFNQTGISIHNDWYRSGYRLCADQSFLTWWIKGAKASKELELTLIDFLSALKANVHGFAEEYQLLFDLRKNLQESIEAGEKMLDGERFEGLRKELHELRILIKSIEGKSEDDYYQNLPVRSNHTK